MQFGVWKIYKCIFIPNCTRKIMWLLIDWKNFEMVKQKKRTRITQSGKNCAINCAIQGVRLIWEQKIWLAICEFLWSLTNQNAWFVTSFCTQLTPFCNVFKKTALLLTNQSGEMVSCILLGIKQIGKGRISSVKRNNFVCHISYGQYSTLTVMIWSDAILLA